MKRRPWLSVSQVVFKKRWCLRDLIPGTIVLAASLNEVIGAPQQPSLAYERLSPSSCVGDLRDFQLVKTRSEFISTHGIYGIVAQRFGKVKH